MNAFTIPPTLSTELMDFLKSIASESRLKIMLLFMDGEERTVTQIVEAVGLGQSTTSEHLAQMKQAGLLLSRREGKEIYYRPHRSRIIQYVDMLSAVLRSCCEP